MFKEVADIKTSDQLHLPVPEAKFETVVVQPSEHQQAMVVELSSLEDLKSLEAQGVEIMTCGTCLDYYGLKDKLAVGSVTNMYSIVETQAKATKIIKP